MMHRPSTTGGKNHPPSDKGFP